MAGRFTLPRATAFDSNGDPISGAKLAFFVSGTSTPQNTYSDDALTVANTNPVIADSAGRFGDIFLLGADYKVTLSDAADVVIWTADPVRAESAKSTVVVTVTTTTQLTTANDGNFIAADATAGAFIITLPAAATAGDGYEVTVQKVDSSTNIVTVDGSGAELINGLSDLNLPDQYSSAVFRCNGTTWFATAITQTTSTRLLPPDFFDGFTLTNNSGDAEHDIDITTGTARSDDDTGNIVLGTSTTKRIDAAFAEGTNQGGLDTGTVAADTVYHLWAIGKTDGTADVLFSLSVTSPTMPSGFTLKVRIGRVKTDTSSNILSTLLGQIHPWGEEVKITVDANSGTSVTVLSDGDIQTDADEITVIGRAVETGTANQRGLLRVGPSAGVVATGYLGRGADDVGGATSNTVETTAFAMNGIVAWDAGQEFRFTAVLSRLFGDLWLSNVTGLTEVGTCHAQGEITLAGDIATMTFVTSAGATFSGSGTISVVIIKRR